MARRFQFCPETASGTFPLRGRVMQYRLPEDEWRPEPTDLLRYFEELVEATICDEFACGLARTQEWIALMEEGGMTQGRFDDFLERVEDTEPPGSGYFVLWLRVRNWGYSLGFAVPDDHPWRVDPNNVQCISNRCFESQLATGSQYRILVRDDSRAMVRIANEQGRHRWYPTNLFKFPQIPARNLVRKPTET